MANPSSRSSALSIPHPTEIDDRQALISDIEFHVEDAEINPDRLRQARETYVKNEVGAMRLTVSEKKALRNAQTTIRTTLFGPSGGASGGGQMSIQELMKIAVLEEEASGGSEEKEEEKDDAAIAIPQASDSPTISNVGAKLKYAKFRARSDITDDGVLGVQDESRGRRYNSVLGDKFMTYNIRKRDSVKSSHVINEEEDSKQEMDLEDISYVRKPNMARIIEEYDALQDHPKYTLKQVLLSRRFHLYSIRFANAQFGKTLYFPTLKQPRELIDPSWICGECTPEEGVAVTEKTRTRAKGHRFIITADTQYGILMDGFAMDFPNWSQEIEISRKCVEQINAMKGEERPLCKYTLHLYFKYVSIAAPNLLVKHSFTLFNSCNCLR